MMLTLSVWVLLCSLTELLQWLKTLLVLSRFSAKTQISWISKEHLTATIVYRHCFSSLIPPLCALYQWQHLIGAFKTFNSALQELVAGRVTYCEWAGVKESCLLLKDTIDRHTHTCCGRQWTSCHSPVFKQEASLPSDSSKWSLVQYHRV